MGVNALVRECIHAVLTAMIKTPKTMKSQRSEVGGNMPYSNGTKIRLIWDEIVAAMSPGGIARN